MVEAKGGAPTKWQMDQMRFDIVRTKPNANEEEIRHLLLEARKRIVQEQITGNFHSYCRLRALNHVIVLTLKY